MTALEEVQACGKTLAQICEEDHTALESSKGKSALNLTNLDTLRCRQ